VSVDNDGNIVGKGDMRAQIEQVGKNVRACLEAAGADPSNIILTRVYVTDTGAFSNNPDIRTRYFGPPSPMSTLVEVPKISSGPEFLVEIEAVAAAE
jgi:enamine deaminase RidA (YjgF/YER057c/UK114 family)